MGAGILPTTLHNGKLYFLFGKEGKYEDSAPGFSDFGGGTDNNESYLETAIREAGEEFTGFLGNDAEVRKMLCKHGTYNIEHKTDGHATYRMHIFLFHMIVGYHIITIIINDFFKNVYLLKYLKLQKYLRKLKFVGYVLMIYKKCVHNFVLIFNILLI